MAKKKTDTASLTELKKALTEKNLHGAYAFYGEERYLLEYYLSAAKKQLVGEGMEEFNYKSFEGKTLTMPDLREALDGLPVFAESTMVVVNDFDIFKADEDIKTRLAELLSDIPEYTCLFFVYDTVPFSPDKRVKANTALLKYLKPVEFGLQETSDLVNWIGRRFKALDKKIDRPTAEYLSFITGGLMTSMVSEIEKIAAFNKGEIITRASIDALVTPVLDAAVYSLTDAIVSGSYPQAAGILSDLLRMQEVPHVISFSISSKLRQLMAARLCVEEGKGTAELMQMAGVRMEFQARNLMTGARRVSLPWCREALRCSYRAAKKLNLTSREGPDILAQLLLELSMIGA